MSTKPILFATLLMVLTTNANASPEVEARIGAFRTLAQECNLHVKFDMPDWRQKCNNALEMGERVRVDLQGWDRSQLTSRMSHNLERAQVDIIEATTLMEFRN